MGPRSRRTVTSGMWLHAIPTASFRPSVDEFREIAAAYFGMPSPIASRFEGQPIYSAKGDQRGTCDKYGARLVSLQLAGDGWNTAHDYFKHALCEVLRDLKVDFSCEVFGLFSSLIPQGPRRSALDADTAAAARARQGLVPDFKIDSGSIGRKLLGASAISSFLAELKFIHLGTVRYPQSVTGRGKHRHAVFLRAGRVGPEMDAAARRCDVEFGGHPAGQDGPVLQRLRSYGGVVPLVVGHFGEWSSELSQMVTELAEEAAPRMAVLFGASSSRAAKSTIQFYARRSLVWAGCIANARLKASRSIYVGPTWAAAATRRQEAARSDDRAFARYRDAAASWHSHHQRSPGANPWGQAFRD